MLADGSTVGTVVGSKVGPGVILIGLKEGSVVGPQVGTPDGAFDGFEVGESVVLNDGSNVGPRLGSEVGGIVPSQQCKM